MNLQGGMSISAMDNATQKEAKVHPIKLFSIIAWLALPTVMFGGYALLGMLVQSNGISPFQETFFRAGHAHAGVLLVMALLYHNYLSQTNLPEGMVWVACLTVLAGVLSVSGGFFLHMAIGAPGSSSAGTLVTTVGAVLLSLAIVLLVYGLITAKSVTV